MPSEPILHRILKDIDFTEDCWLWRAAKTQEGYAVIKQYNQQKYVHRLLWEMMFGGIPDKYFLCRTCPHKHCCNPNHLKLDPLVSKPAPKLTREKVRELKELYQKGVPSKVLEEKYQISQSHVSCIVRGKAWTNLDDYQP